MVDQYQIRQLECAWKMTDYPQTILECNYDRGYCLDAVDRFPLGGVAKAGDNLYTFTYSRSIGLALSSFR